MQKPKEKRKVPDKQGAAEPQQPAQTAADNKSLLQELMSPDLKPTLNKTAKFAQQYSESTWQQLAANNFSVNKNSLKLTKGATSTNKRKAERANVKSELKKVQLDELIVTPQRTFSNRNTTGVDTFEMTIKGYQSQLNQYEMDKRVGSVVRYPRIDMTATTNKASKTKTPAKRKKNDHFTGNSQESFDNFSLIEPQKDNPLRVSTLKKLSDYDPDYQQVAYSPNLMMHCINDKVAANNMKNHSTKQSPDPKSALSHFESFQDQKLKKIHMNFSNSIKQAESSLAQEAAQSVEIQNKIMQMRSIGTNIKRNILQKGNRRSQSIKEEHLADSRVHQNKSQMQIDKLPKNDYQAYLQDNQESLSALNTLSLRNNHYRTELDPKVRIQQSQKAKEYKTIAAPGQFDDVEGPSIQDSIMSNEFELIRFRDSFDDVHSFNRLQTNKSRFLNSHNYCSKEAIIQQQIREAQGSVGNQSKVERLMQMDYVVNSINTRFKSRILDKFEVDSQHRRSQVPLPPDRGARPASQLLLKPSLLSEPEGSAPGSTGNPADVRKSCHICDDQSPLKKAEYEEAPFRLQKVNIDEFREANRIMRDSQPNIMRLLRDGYKQAEGDFIEERFSNLDDYIKQRENRKSRIPNELRIQTHSTCQDLDQIIKQKKDQEQTNAKLLRAVIDQDLKIEELESHDLDDPITSSLEKKRRRIVGQFEQKIKKQKKMLDEVQNYIESNVDPDQKALRILSKLNCKASDSDPNLTLSDIEPHTARFLADLIGDVMNQAEKHKMLSQLSKQIQFLIDRKDEFDQKMKDQMRVRRAEQDVKNLLHKGIFSLNFQAMMHKKKEEKQGYKEKFVFVNKIEQQDQKDKKGFKKIVRKHYNKLVDRQIDMAFMTKMVNMLKQFENIFGRSDLGVFYKKMNKANLWANDYMRHNDLEINFLDNQKSLNDINTLYVTEVQTTQFYTDLKKEKVHRLEPSQTEKLANLEFMNKLEKAYQTTLPTFARMVKNQLILSELRFTDEMAQGLADYLQAVKDNPQKIAKELQIDNCSMKDGQLAEILRGLEAQGSHLKTLVYSCGELGRQSQDVLLRLLPNLRGLYLNNLSKGCSKPMLLSILNQIENQSSQIQKLKFSNINLADNEIVQSICMIIDQRVLSLIHLDLSWSKLQPKQLNTIIKTLNEMDILNLKNLNLSYNSLVQPPQGDKSGLNQSNPEIEASCEFVENVCDFMRKNNLLNHVDLSGMNLNAEQILAIADTTLTQSESLLVIHLSDNGIGFDHDLRDEILDMMGLSNDIFRILQDDEFKNNQRILNPEGLKKAIKSHTLSLRQKDHLNSAHTDANTYTSRLLQSKQGRQVMNHMTQHKVQTSGGVGRLESNLVDQFVLGRNVNHAELVFNQQPYVDKYFEMDSADKWRLFDSACGIYGGCPICNRHKYATIFYEQDLEDPWSHNEGLIEIKDRNLVDKIKEDLNISFRYDTDIAPIIVGSVVTGGFKRKLKMMRADYYSILSIIDSIYTIESSTASKAIKRGVLANLTKNQDINRDDKHLKYLHGWHKGLIVDKCLKNEIEDVFVVNFPQDLKPKMPSQSELKHSDVISVSFESPLMKLEDQYQPNKDCTIFVYAALIPPGVHQFLIYCPKTHRAFCKDFVVDLSECEPFPEYPEKFKPQQKEKKLTRQNVWRHWRVDGDENIRMAYLADTQKAGDPTPQRNQGDKQKSDSTSFIRNQEDQHKCNTLLIQNFEMIQTTFMELTASNSQTYPRIGFETMLQTLQGMQKSEQEKKALPRAQIELAFICTTRGSGAKGTSGSLNRGQYIEMILRLAQQRYPNQKISERLLDFLDTYIKPNYRASSIITIRQKLRESKQLNQLLFDNRKGLTFIFEDYSEFARGFTLGSAKKLLNALCTEDPENEQHLIPNMQKVFSFSKMMILKERQDEHKYHSLVYVEFLDFLCRVAIEIVRIEQQKIPADVHVTVFELLNRIWEYRAANPDGVPARQAKKGQDEPEEFPELVPLMEIDDDEDE